MSIPRLGDKVVWIHTTGKRDGEIKVLPDIDGQYTIEDKKTKVWVRVAPEEFVLVPKKINKYKIVQFLEEWC